MISILLRDGCLYQRGTDVLLLDPLKMLDDNPRLHITIEPPLPIAGESQSDYTTRANKEFDIIVKAFTRR